MGEPEESWHDPELPFLDVLEGEVRRRAERAALAHQQRRHLPSSDLPRSGASIQRRRAAHRESRGGAGVDTAPSRAARRRDAVRGPLRIARRSLTLMTLLCLIGASAFGASKVFSKSTPNPLGGRPGAFALVARGASGSEAWQLRLYERSDELCRSLSVSETETSDCAAMPSPAAVEVTSAESPGRRYLFGVVGTQVRRVRVHFAGANLTVRTHAPAASLLRAHLLPAHVRYYVVAFSRPTSGTAPRAEVEGLGTHGRPLGTPVPSCLETGESGRC